MADKKQANRRNRNNQDDDYNPKFRKIRKITIKAKKVVKS